MDLLSTSLNLVDYGESTWIKEKEKKPKHQFVIILFETDEHSKMKIYLLQFTNLILKEVHGVGILENASSNESWEFYRKFVSQVARDFTRYEE